MKKSILLYGLLLHVLVSMAQEPADALRYSWITQNGTARNQAIGGAGVSLGGEFSTMFINPAGLGFYKTSELVLSPAFNFINNESTYFGQKNQAKKSGFVLGPTGIIFGLPASNKSGSLKNITIGLGINQSANFNNSIYYKGQNNKSSYSEKFLEELISNRVTDPNNAARNFPYGSSLAFNTYLIDTVTINGKFGYRSLATVGSGLIQENRISSSGKMTDIALNLAANYNEKLFVGGTIGIPVVNYERQSNFRESDATNLKTNNFDHFEVIENLRTKGVGINIKAGLIYKPVEYFRLGLALTSPTFLTLTETYSTEVITDLEGYGGAGIKKQNSKDLNNGEPGQFKYDLATPWKVAASASYVFREVENVKKQRAFITADLEYVNHKASRFKEYDNSAPGTGGYLTEVNNAVKDEYKGAINLKLGGELKFNTIMFRLGGAYYGNPYRYEKAGKVNLTGGLGYRDKGIFIDLAYVHSLNKDVNYPYTLADNAGFDRAYLKPNGGKVALTVGFKL